VASSRNVLIAGAGIGVIERALMLAQSGFRVTLLEQAERLEETAPASSFPRTPPDPDRAGLGSGFAPTCSEPQAVAIKTATGSTLAASARREAERRYTRLLSIPARPSDRVAEAVQATRYLLRSAPARRLRRHSTASASLAPSSPPTSTLLH